MSLHEWLSWRQGQLGCAAVAGLLFIVAPSLICIGLDLAGITRQVQPPPFYGDFVPQTQEVCLDLPGGSVAVAKSNKEFHDRRWPRWPAPEGLDCEGQYDRAPAGTVRWHSCDGFLQPNGELTSPCPPDRAGATYAWLDDAGEVEAVDIYVRAGGPSCSWPHEEAHARGFLATPEEDEATKYVDGAHTEKPDHLLGESCGGEWKWLDRRKDGDWPYAGETP